MDAVKWAQLLMRGHSASPLGAMDRLPEVAALTGKSPDLAGRLVTRGWSVQRLGTLADLDEHSLEGVALGLEEADKRPVDMEELRGLIEVSAVAAKLAWEIEGRSPNAELLIAHMARELEIKINEQRKEAMKNLRDLIPRKGKAKIERWPTRLEKKLYRAGDDQDLRAKAEKDERTRWMLEIRKLLREAEAPAMLRAAVVEGVDMSRRFGKGRRASTLRKHAKTWAKVRNWMKVTFGRPWPESPEEFALFLECRAREPCGKTVPGSVYRTLLFMESAGEFPPEQQLGKSAAIRNTLEEVNMQLESQASRFTKKAWHMPVKMVVALEKKVLECHAENYPRVYAWFRLVKLWSGMRFADTTGLDHSTLEWQSFGLTGVLNRTKTTGPGKKVTLLRIFISKDCWLECETWLTTGYELWVKLSQEAGLMDRDFMLPCPAASLESFGRRMANYAMASRLSHALLNDLKVEFEDAEVPMLAEGVCTLWTEHSERATMRTWAEGAGIPEYVRKQMGRWTPTVDQAYERNARSNILRAQSAIASFIKRNMGARDHFDEALIMAAIAERMERLGHAAVAIQIQVQKLGAFGKHGQPKRVRLTEPDQIRGEDEPEFDDGWHLIGGVPKRPELPEDGMRLDSSDEEENPVQEDALGGEGSQGGPMVSRGTYVLSIIGRSEKKTLHRVGECHRIPGIHYGKFQVVGNDPPSAEMFHQSCKICFPQGDMQMEGSGSELSEEDDNSSSDSSTSVEETEDES